MMSGKQDTSPRIHVEAPQRSGDRTGQAQLAGRIKEENNAFADAVTLAACPEADPLGDREVFARSCAPHRIVDVKRNFYGLHGRASGRRPALDAFDRARENQSGGADHSWKAHRPCQPGWRTWSDGGSERYVLRSEMLRVEIKGRVPGQGSGMNCSALAHQSRTRENQQRNCEQTENSFPVQGNDLSQSSARRKNGETWSGYSWATAEVSDRYHKRL